MKNMSSDTSTLFEQHTIQEIVEIEKKLRNDIERKKEELRQMVGERYRDLIDAADTITEMKNITGNINFHIDNIEKQFNELPSDNWHTEIMQSVKLKITERQKENENTYIIACLIKILMDAPAKIWWFIENEDFLKALQVFLLARHVHSMLVLDSFYTKHNVLSQFPVINKQWSSIYHFQYTLLQKSQELLLSERLKANSVVGPLCCIVFLSDASLIKIFEDILVARKVAIFNIFKPEKSVKSQICDLVGIIQNCLETVYTLFYQKAENGKNDENNLILRVINKVTSQNEPGPISLMDQLQASPVIQYLPKDISAYRFSLKNPVRGIDVDHLHNSCNNWLQRLKSELKKTLEDLLDFVATIKGLAVIQDAITNQLSETSSWDEMCLHLLKQKFSIWDFFLKEFFMRRINAIICHKIETAKNVCIREVDKVFIEFQNKNSPRIQFEENISSYIWTESDVDLASNLGWNPHQQRNLWNSGTLGMKSYGLTPKVQSICSLLDKKLENLLEDIDHFTKRKKDEEQQNFMLRDPQEPNQNRQDCQSINVSLAHTATESLTELTDHLKKTLKSLDEEFSNQNSEISTKIVFIGHLCSGLSKLCPHLMKCLILGNNKHHLSTFSSPLFTNAAKDDQSWTTLKNNLLQLENEAFKIWSLGTIKIVVEKFNSVFIVCSANGILASMLQWDRIEIQEESEEGDSVKSVLKIPQQVSVPLYNCLYNFCQKMNEIGGHSLSRQLRSEIRKEFLLQLLKVYRNKSNETWPEDVFCPHLAQTQSLQLLFDVQFLVGLMSPKDNSNNEISIISKETIDKIVSFIDPFDMDVFSKYLRSNVKKGLQKSMLLLGLIAAPEQVTHFSGMKSFPSSQMDHNLMLMPNINCRLPLLPFATRSTSIVTSTVTESTKNLSVQASPLKSTHSSSPNLSAVSDNLTNVLKSSSFYHRVTAMSSSWFGSS